MKICLYTNTIYKIGGVARVTVFLANQWALSHDITVISTNSDYSMEDIVYPLDPAITQIQDPALFIHDDSFSLIPDSAAKLAALIHRNDYDVVVGVEGKFAVALASALHDFSGVKIAWMHNSYDAYFKTEHEYLWKLDKVFEAAMLHYDATVVLTEADKKKFDAHFGLQTRVIVNPITVDAESGHYKGDIKKLLTVCRVAVKHKGLDLLLEVLPHIFEKHPDWSWHLVGDGPDMKWIQNQVRARHLEDYVVLHGAAHDVTPYYRDASVFILPSRWEGMPMVSLEAMHFGLPLVGFNIDALREVQGATLSAMLLVDQYDVDALASVINHMIEDDAFRCKASQLSLQRVDHFKLTEIAQTWEHLFQMKDCKQN